MSSKRLDMLDTLVAQDSKDPFHWYARALELRSLERLDEALEAFEAVKLRFADYVPTYLMAGQVAESLGQTARARGWYTEGLSCAKARGEAHAASELTAALEALQPE